MNLVLDQVPVGTGPNGTEQILILVTRREHQHASRRQSLPDRPGGLYAAHPGHTHVHDHGIGSHVGRPNERVHAVPGLADDYDVRLGGQEAPQRVAKYLVVVDNQHRDDCAPNLFVGRSRRRCAIAPYRVSSGMTGGDL